MSATGAIVYLIPHFYRVRPAVDTRPESPEPATASQAIIGVALFSVRRVEMNVTGVYAT